jgi:hypothetical protein
MAPVLERKQQHAGDQLKAERGRTERLGGERRKKNRAPSYHGNTWPIRRDPGEHTAAQLPEADLRKARAFRSPERATHSASTPPDRAAREGEQRRAPGRGHGSNADRDRVRSRSLLTARSSLPLPRRLVALCRRRRLGLAACTVVSTG